MCVCLCVYGLEEFMGLNMSVCVCMYVCVCVCVYEEWRNSWE